MAANYLGQFPVEVVKTPQEWAMTFIHAYGQIDGSHHKTWVLDQVSRILQGTPVITEMAKWGPSENYPNGHEELRFWTAEDPSQEYKDWVIEMIGEDDKGEPECEYDVGIAP